VSINLKAIRETQLPIAKQAASDAAHLTSRLKEIAERLDVLSNSFIEHLEQPSTDEQGENNRKLWHDLNSLEHLIQQFSSHSTSSIKEFMEESIKLVQAIRKCR
jgi:hypothetical protein